VSDCCLTPSQVSNFSAIWMAEEVTFWWDNDDVCFAPDQHVGIF
jgi:hypothetical protein